MTTIDIKNITKIIKKNTVLDNISLTMSSGKIYGFQGINGSGKTMLMRCIIGLIHPTSGCISINGKFLGKDIEFPESIGFLLENPAFLDGYTGIENLRMLTKLNSNLTDTELNTILDKVELTDAGNKKYKKYSLGMKQRLGIAAAVMEHPDILILDEPTNALDTNGINIVKDIIVSERNRGALVIISCHDTDLLINLSDEIFRLQAGQLVEHTVKKSTAK
ncbi:ATP-binding cassette domain-containing protein [Lachnospiraceae bacterium HCP1S3_C3]|nr:ATP-binding cassette domain-containing protein [Lachnospiraceae bacterium]